MDEERGMQSFTRDRFAIYVIAAGGEILAEAVFADPGAARAELDRLAAAQPGAERVVLIDRSNGHILDERRDMRP